MSNAGRKSKQADVIPYRDKNDKVADNERNERIAARHDRMAQERAAALKPKGLPHAVAKIWDIMAPAACHPTKNRVVDTMSAHAFAMLCYEVERFHRHSRYLMRKGETYESETRNGFQLKNRPEVGQQNIAWGHVWRAMLEFGMTPNSAKNILNDAPPGLFDDEDEDSEDEDFS